METRLLCVGDGREDGEAEGVQVSVCVKCTFAHLHREILRPAGRGPGGGGGGRGTDPRGQTVLWEGEQMGSTGRWRRGTEAVVASRFPGWRNRENRQHSYPPAGGFAAGPRRWCHGSR